MDWYEIQNRKIKQCLKCRSNDNIEVAQRLAYMKDHELYKPYYRNITEYAYKEHDLDRRRVAEMLKVVYRFCEKRKNTNQYSTGYFVKSLFKNYDYSKLVLMLDITEEEIVQLELSPGMTYRKIHSIIIDFKKSLMKINDIEKVYKNDVPVHEVDDFYKLEHAEMQFHMDSAKIKGRDKPLDFRNGWLYFRDMVLSDHEHDYMIVKVKHVE